MGNSMDVSLKTREKNYHMTQQSHYLAYGLRKPNWKSHMYPNVHCNTIYNS